MPPDLNSNYEPLVLTDGTDALTEDTQMAGMYNITGATTQYFYLPISTTAIEIIDILFKVATAQTLYVKLEALSQGAADWKEIPAYTTATYAADGTSQLLNSAFPLRHIIPAGNQYRVACTVGASCKIGVQVMGRAL